ncbi:hypothetical protein [Luteolibacter sp.]|uniref:hypothetical protein n=1 Tax=Luteolibacter sp. TaxID=1962973 RepID=UPI003264C369
MKFLPLLFCALCANPDADASSIVIDDFTFDQGPFYDTSGNLGGVDSEISDPSIFGGERRLFATGYIRFIGTDTAGTSFIGVTDGSLSFSKTAASGSAFVSYNGRLHTLGDRIGDLNLDVAGSATSLASPIVLLEYSQLDFAQMIFISLSSSLTASNFYNILLPAGSTETYFDLRTETPISGGSVDPLDFSAIDEIGLGLSGSSPVGSVKLDRFSFVPEPSASLLGALAGLGLLRRRRDSRPRNRPVEAGFSGPFLLPIREHYRK